MFRRYIVAWGCTYAVIEMITDLIPPISPIWNGNDPSYNHIVLLVAQGLAVSFLWCLVVGGACGILSICLSRYLTRNRIGANWLKLCLVALCIAFSAIVYAFLYSVNVTGPNTYPGWDFEKCFWAALPAINACAVSAIVIGKPLAVQLTAKAWDVGQTVS